MPWLYQNAGQTLVCEYFMRVRFAFWNRLDDKLKNMTNESNLKKHLLEKFLDINASRKHFSITRTF